MINLTIVADNIADMARQLREASHALSLSTKSEAASSDEHFLREISKAPKTRDQAPQAKFDEPSDDSPGPDDDDVPETSPLAAPLTDKKTRGRGRPGNKKAAPPAPIQNPTEFETVASASNGHDKAEAQIEDEDEDEDGYEEEQDVITPNSLLKPKLEDVVSALQKVNHNCGLPEARKLLSQFKSARISEVPEASYKEFIKACSKAVSDQARA